MTIPTWLLVIIVCLFVVAVMPAVEGLMVWLSLRDEPGDKKEDEP